MHSVDSTCLATWSDQLELGEYHAIGDDGDDADYGDGDDADADDGDDDHDDDDEDDFHPWKHDSDKPGIDVVKSYDNKNDD